MTGRQHPSRQDGNHRKGGCGTQSQALGGRLELGHLESVGDHPAPQGRQQARQPEGSPTIGLAGQVPHPQSAGPHQRGDDPGRVAESVDTQQRRRNQQEPYALGGHGRTRPAGNRGYQGDLVGSSHRVLGSGGIAVQPHLGRAETPPELLAVAGDGPVEHRPDRVAFDLHGRDTGQLPEIGKEPQTGHREKRSRASPGDVSRAGCAFSLDFDH